MKLIRINEYKTLTYRLVLVYIFYFLARFAFYSFNYTHLNVEGISDFFALGFLWAIV